MNNFECFKKWAPDHLPWSAWVKPVLFATMSDSMEDGAELPEMAACGWAPPIEERSALIVDCAGAQSIICGLSLFVKGYQPVPLFNCNRGGHDVIVVDRLQELLCRAAAFLNNDALAIDAPPVFLLDSNRLSNAQLVAPGMFDNRWCTMPQDFPSATLLRLHSINRVVVRTTMVLDDCAQVLQYYKKAGMEVLIANDDSPLYTDYQKPSFTWLRNLLYRALVTMNLRRNAAGGFGGRVPVPSSSGSS